LLDCLVVHALVEDLECLGALSLGAIHGDIGVAQVFLGALPGLVAHRHADACGRNDLVVVHLDWLQQCCLNTLGRARRLVDVADVVDDDHEFVTAESADDVVLAQAALEPPTDLDEKAIPREVAETVVHDLETVQVEKQHGELVVGIAVGALDRARQDFEHQRSVGQAGEGVVKGIVLELALGQFALGDVHHIDEHVVAAGIRVVTEGEDALAGADLDVAKTAAGHHALGDQVAVVRRHEVVDRLEIEVAQRRRSRRVHVFQRTVPAEGHERVRVLDRKGGQALVLHLGPAALTLDQFLVHQRQRAEQQQPEQHAGHDLCAAHARRRHREPEGQIPDEIQCRAVGQAGNDVDNDQQFDQIGDQPQTDRGAEQPVDHRPAATRREGGDVEEGEDEHRVERHAHGGRGQWR